MREALESIFRLSDICFSISEDEDLVTFRGPSGLSCEFGTSAGDYLVGTFDIDGKERFIDLHVDEDSAEIFRVVNQILNPA